MNKITKDKENQKNYLLWKKDRAVSSDKKQRMRKEECWDEEQGHQDIKAAAFYLDAFYSIQINI